MNDTNYLKSENLNENEIVFNNYPRKYCVCIASIVDFTNYINKLKESVEIRTFYSVFYNTLSSIIKNHDGKVIKSMDDNLLFYFPKTVNLSLSSAFQNVLECGMAMIQANSTLNKTLVENSLPPISYRISANYGLVELATSSNSNDVDLFGPTVNICSKINYLASPNEMVIYKDFYDVIKELKFFKDYDFKVTNKNKINREYFVYSSSVYSVNPINKFELNKSIHNITKIDQFEQVQNKRNLLATSSINILLVDDDKDVLFTIKQVLEYEGYNITSFSDSVKALDHLSSLDPYYYDLIVTDIRMPGFNGFQLFKQIKVLNMDSKVLFLSALDVSEEIMFVCPGMSATDVIRKPVDRSDLLFKIRSVLES